MNDELVKLARVGLLLALAVVIHSAEAMLPVTVLWFRFGFANIMGLATLYLFGFKYAVIVTLGRVFLGSLVTGLFGSPAFLLSLSGSLAAIVVMGLAKTISRERFSEIGVSILGAVTHNAAQLLVAYVILIRNEAILYLLPLMLAAALITGFINGLAARFLIAHFREADTRLHI
jgi:heptaprenyl diphosphate synthase